MISFVLHTSYGRVLISWKIVRSVCLRVAYVQASRHVQLVDVVLEVQSGQIPHANAGEDFQPVEQSASDRLLFRVSLAQQLWSKHTGETAEKEV